MGTFNVFLKTSIDFSVLNIVLIQTIIGQNKYLNLNSELENHYIFQERL